MKFTGFVSDVRTFFDSEAQNIKLLSSILLKITERLQQPNMFNGNRELYTFSSYRMFHRRRQGSPEQSPQRSAFLEFYFKNNAFLGTFQLKFSLKPLKHNLCSLLRV